MGVCTSNPKNVDDPNKNMAKNDQFFTDDVKSNEQDAGRDFADEIRSRESDDELGDLPNDHYSADTHLNDQAQFTQRDTTLDFRMARVSPPQSTDSYRMDDYNPEFDDDDNNNKTRPHVRREKPKTQPSGKPKNPIKKNEPIKFQVNASAAKRAKELKAIEERRIAEKRALQRKSPSHQNLRKYANSKNNKSSPPPPPRKVKLAAQSSRSPGERLYDNAVQMREKQLQKQKSVENAAIEASNAYKKKTNRAPRKRRTLTDLSTQQLSKTEKKLLEQFREVDFFSLENAKHKNRVVVPMKSQQWMVKLIKPESDRDLRSAVFQAVEGLVGNVAGSISFACVNYPDAYLRHENGRIKLRRIPRDEPMNWRKDATWRVKAGLNEDRKCVSFESVSKPDWYIYVDNFSLVVKKRAAPVKGACFMVVPSVIDMESDQEYSAFNDSMYSHLNEDAVEYSDF